MSATLRTREIQFAFCFIFKCVCECVPLPACQEVSVESLPRLLFSCLLRQSLTEYCLGWLTRKPLGPSSLHSPALGLQVSATFFLGCWGPRSGPHAWTRGRIPTEPLLSSYLRHFSPLGHDIWRAEAGREHLELGEKTEARSPRGLSCDFTGPGHEGDTAWQLWNSGLSAHAP